MIAKGMLYFSSTLLLVFSCCLFPGQVDAQLYFGLGSAVKQQVKVLKEKKEARAAADRALLRAPSNLRVSALSPSQVRLTWQDNSGGRAGFKIARKTGVSSVYSVITSVVAGVQTYIDSGLNAETSYSYKVVATDAGGAEVSVSNAVYTFTLPPPGTPATKWSSVSAGSDHSLAIKADRTLWAWGYNLVGQLGLGDTSTRVGPVKVGTASNWASVSAGFTHSLAIKTDGTLWAWGSNSSGELGIGNTTSTSTPTQVGTGNNWASIYAGSGFSFAIKTDGTLWAWGDNVLGNSGIGMLGLPGGNLNSPTRLGTDSDWSAIASNNDGGLGYIGYIAAIKTDGSIWVWGDDLYAQMYTTSLTYPSPIRLEAATDWASVEAGSGHSLAIKTDGSLWTWGVNSYGELGIGGPTGSSAAEISPVRIGNVFAWAFISASLAESYGIKNDGTLWSWGANTFGSLGHGDLAARTVPTQVGTDTKWMYLSAGPTFAIAVKSDGTLWSWGENTFGELGIGNTTDCNVPTQIP